MADSRFTESAVHYAVKDDEERLLSTSYEQASDLDLAHRARDGDESAFAEIMRRYSPRVFYVANRFFRQRSLVEDAAQEVFLKAFTQLENFEGRGSLEGWITRIATNTCLNMIRGSKRRPELTTSDLTEDESNWLDDKLANVATERYRSSERSMIAADLADRVLRTLSPDDQLVLTLMDGEELSVNDVVKLTGWSESKVKVTSFRARRRMREAVEKLLGRKAGTKQPEMERAR
jgi:RNA polymerase sigma-70 factor (ECF subfamily)